MKTEEIAKRLVSLCRESKWEQAQKELFSPDAVSIEPYATPAFEKETRGLNAIVEKGMAKMNKAGNKGAPPKLVAEAIWKAATDGKSTLRYVVGKDAKSLLATRRLVSDGVYRKMIKASLLK